MVLRVGFSENIFPHAETWALMILSVREHFASPLLQFAEADEGATFELVECPGELRRKNISEK
jgi:hypothetical protein